jgi:thiamine-phosphate pyrophosphorylase
VKSKPFILSFENGLELLHVRKPEFTKLEMEVLFQQLDKNIETYFHCTIIINWQKHLELIAFILQKKRNETSEYCLIGKNEDLNSYLHSMSDFEKLSNVFDYAFLDPFSKVFLNQSTFQILILKKN